MNCAWDRSASSSIDLDYASDMAESDDGAPTDVTSSAGSDDEGLLDDEVAPEMSRAFAQIVNAGLDWVAMNSCWLFHSSEETKYKMIARTHA